MSEQDEKIMTTPPDESGEDEGAGIPIWVALAGLVVAFILASIIMVEVLPSISNLIFPEKAEVPLPPDAELIQEIEETTVSDQEWLYGSQTMDACRVTQFYLEQEAQCVVESFTCTTNADGDMERDPVGGSTASIRCTYQATDEVDGYSWEVYIADGNEPYLSRFRVYLYEGR